MQYHKLTVGGSFKQKVNQYDKILIGKEIATFGDNKTKKQKFSC